MSTTSPTTLKDALKRISELEIELQKLKESPYFDTLLALIFQQDYWNNQLQDRPINLFADKDSKEFDRAKWYLENMLEVSEKRAELIKRISPEQNTELPLKIAEQRIKKQRMAIAEKIALNGND